MRNQLKTFYSALLIVATLGLTSTVHGVPAFARQTGLDCNSCHAASGFPTLNAFGAAFKAGGYSQANEDDLIGDGEALSIPKTLNISVVLKAMNPIKFATDTPATGSATNTSSSELILPDEMALLIGGRIGKNAGFLIESGLGNDGRGGKNSALGAKFVFAPEIGPVRLGIVPWWSDLGAGYMFETMSTGAVNNLRAAEEIKGSAQTLGMNGQAQGGLGIYVWHPMGFVAFTPYFNGNASENVLDANNDPWGNKWSTTDSTTGYTDKSSDNLAYYIRAAVTPSFGDVALAIGVQLWNGKTTQDDGNGTYVVYDVNTFVVDAQAMMDIGLPISIYATFGMDSSVTNTTNMAATAYVEAAIVPDVFMAGALFKLHQTDDTTIVNTFTDYGVALKYHLFRNLKVELDVVYAMESNDQDSATKSEFLILPMIFGAF